MDYEKIKFDISFITQYWNNPPSATIYIDNVELFNGKISTSGTISFYHELVFGPHQLSIRRTGKTNDEVKLHEDGTWADQLLILDQIKIDGIDIKNIVESKSWNEPVYPEPWASEQSAQGQILEEKIIAETHFGHNGTWRLNFSSPFYQFLYNAMDNQI